MSKLLRYSTALAVATSLYHSTKKQNDNKKEVSRNGVKTTGIRTNRGVAS